MSIEQSIVNDVVDVKSAISDNWEDILATADSIEKLITDGLEWVLAQDKDKNYIHLDQIKEMFENVANTIENDLDLSTIEQDFDKAIGSVEADLSQYLDPMLAQLKNIEEDMNPEELFKLIENSMPDIPGLSEVTEGLEDVLSPMKRIIQEVLKEGFSIKLKDLPLPAGATQTDSVNGDSSLFDVLTSGLDTHMDTVFNKHGDTIESLLNNFFGLINKDVITSLETSTKDLVTQFESGAIDTKTLMSSLKTLLSNEGETAKDLGQDFISKISSEIESTSTLLSDLLTEEIDNEIFQIIWPNHTCTLTSITSLFIAIPISLIDTSIDDLNRPILSVLNKSTPQKYNPKDVAYGAMQIMDGITMVAEILPDLISEVDADFSEDNQKKYLWYNLILSVSSLGFNIPAQLVSKPLTSEEVKEKNKPKELSNSLKAQIRWQWGVWGFQWVFSGFAAIETLTYGYLLNLRPASRNTTEKSSGAKFEEKVNSTELILAIIELSLEYIHLVLFVGLLVTENRYANNAKESNLNTDSWKKPLYFVDVIPGIVGNGCEIYRLQYDLNNANVKFENKPSSYFISAFSELMIDFISQSIYGCLYVGYGQNSAS